MMTPTRWLFSLYLLCLAGTAAAAIDPAMVRKRESDAATVIQRAYELRDGKTYRRKMNERLVVLAAMRHAEKVAAVAGYRDAVRARGAQGLEGLLLSAHGELASSGGRSGYAAAQASLAELGKIWRIATDLQAPNALVPIARPGVPFVHHLPIAIVRATVANQLKTGVPLIDRALADAHCSPQALAALAVRYGQAFADQVGALCQGAATPPNSSDPNLGGLGFAAGMSDFDCIQAHQQTHAERFDELMRACNDSLLVDGGTNPLAQGSGSIASVLVPLPETRKTEPGSPRWPLLERRSETDVTPTGTIVDRLYKDETKTELEEVVIDDAVEAKVEHDDKGDVTTVTFKDEEGKTIAVSEYSHDENGDIIVKSTIPESDDAKLRGEIGSTEACRQLSLFVISDRLGDEMARVGERPPGYAVDPSPDAAVGRADPTLDCMGLTGGALVDSAIQCRMPTMCPMGKIPDQSCTCKPAPGTASPVVMCAATIRCIEGESAVEKDGVCSCTGEAIVDNTGGIGPVPVDSSAARTGWQRR